MALINCDNISLSYEKNTIVTNLSFKVKEGDYLCIVGENGSGKSTLIKVLLSLKDVSKGRILMGDGLRQNEVGYLPQQTDTQRDFPASVWEIVISGCLNSRGLRPYYSKSDRAKALKNMEKLGISELKKRSYSELSGGQQQRVLLARALCATKKLLLLDEPVSGLDPVVTNEFYQIIRQLNEDGITIIMVSHDIASSVKYASHILHLRRDTTFFGTCDEYTVSNEGRYFLGGELLD